MLSFFHAPPSEYTVVFSHNATGALKLVGESFPFSQASSYVLSADSHNSVHGIRQFASARGSRVCYIPSQRQGGVDLQAAKVRKAFIYFRYPDIMHREECPSPQQTAVKGSSSELVRSDRAIKYHKLKVTSFARFVCSFLRVPYPPGRRCLGPNIQHLPFRYSS